MVSPCFASQRTLETIAALRIMLRNPRISSAAFRLTLRVVSPCFASQRTVETVATLGVMLRNPRIGSVAFWLYAPRGLSLLCFAKYCRDRRCARDNATQSSYKVGCVLACASREPLCFASQRAFGSSLRGYIIRWRYTRPTSLTALSRLRS